ncbi:undecaprenyldiphospho-muramoylpentapeptide beta-N-acetylglucosaminyltransferase [Brachybacterium saurashtrense]|uniref:UDP-N-acetylglucosamine--N-acetylmuramyl-(pentapeptide) pyrophosphoryl-undecaprenol N-acetylglucosamine transferase n=1 Tax=Brachybacterium saurashtrense TaxID=556288 RepID=A0A345YL34_9MICO|nr:undecaprenyldiphospho-muramoylpentapeptide beta-N-acetylglucosaminyltransferase [Brachybacterium saurashtrense]AXK44636.1 undecaprenyldiphospho-muramoylpentapeptide beta-N-acetylglucosaminyltransferase [Brachybacterium saurashtrense]RRR23248.1 undecaprenyldiphospho-muramoylpentapeptide beta-N-acetylglucosaminyltransferase [Brachybacterium saurashtrense]
MSSTAPRILLAGGGSAGHVSPLLATAAQISRRSPEAEVIVLGTQEGLEADLVPAAGYELVTIDKVPFPRRPNGSALRFPGRFAATLRQVGALLREREIDVVAGFGGYVCPPAYLAAARSRTPLVVHEANRRPGLANRLGARRAAAVLTAFEGSTLPGARRIGMPMREAIAHLHRPARRDAAVRALGLDPARPVLLATGGSLGAQRLNAAVAEVAAEFAEAGAQILHVTGRGKAEGLTPRDGYVVREYVSAMEDAYAAADLALTRSGAGTVSELTAVGLPSVLVPLPIGNGEQALNGEQVVAAGGALMVPDAELDAAHLRAVVLPLLRDPARRAEMSAAARAFGIADAAEVMADVVTGVARRA